MDLKPLKKKAEGRPPYERHVLLCAGLRGVEGGVCCTRDVGLQTWKYLGKRLAELKKQGRHFYRTEAECLMFCRGGPLMIVYPEGVWYAGVTSEVCEQIIQEHLLEGHIVERFAFNYNPMNAGASSSGENEG